MDRHIIAQSHFILSGNAHRFWSKILGQHRRECASIVFTKCHLIRSTAAAAVLYCDCCGARTEPEARKYDL